MRLITFPFWLDSQNQGLGWAQAHRPKRLCVQMLVVPEPTAVVWEGRLLKTRQFCPIIRPWSKNWPAREALLLTSLQASAAVADCNSAAKGSVLWVSELFGPEGLNTNHTALETAGSRKGLVNCVCFREDADMGVGKKGLCGEWAEEVV